MEGYCPSKLHFCFALCLFYLDGQTHSKVERVVCDVAEVCGAVDFRPFLQGLRCGRGQPRGVPWAGRRFICLLNKQSRKCSGDCGTKCCAEVMSSPGAVRVASPKVSPNSCHASHLAMHGKTQREFLLPSHSPEEGFAFLKSLYEN